MYQHIIAYFSAAGSTRLVAEIIEQSLTRKNHAPLLIELGRQDRLPQPAVEIMTQHPTCLWLGSPVYCDHALPLVHDCIAALPRNVPVQYAVPFVTWGGVTSGLALLEMATQLLNTHWIPLAAAKILAVHSSMWRVPEPLGSGHPDKDDRQQIQRLVDRVTYKLCQPNIVPLALAELDYLSPSLRAEAVHKNLEAAKTAMPRCRVDEQLCIQCGTCAEACPVNAIAMTPSPETDRDTCILCLQCIRSCPQQAYPFDGNQGAARIMAMAAASDEEKQSSFFY